MKPNAKFPIFIQVCTNNLQHNKKQTKLVPLMERMTGPLIFQTGHETVAVTSCSFLLPEFNGQHNSCW